MNKTIQLTDRMKEISIFFKDLPGTYFVGGCVRDKARANPVREDVIVKMALEI